LLTDMQRIYDISYLSVEIKSNVHPKPAAAMTKKKLGESLVATWEFRPLCNI